MKTKTIKHKNTNLVHTIITSRMSGDVHTALSECEKVVYADALFAGCSGKSRQEFLNELKKLGSRLSISYSEGFLNIKITTTKQNLTKTLSLVKKMVLKPNFESKEIKRIKKLVNNQLVIAKENARMQSDRNFEATLIKKSDQRYPFSTDELIKNIGLVKRSKLLKLHKEVLNASWAMSISGNSASIKEVEKVFEKINKNKSDSEIQLEPIKTKAIKKNVLIFDEIPSKQNIEFNIGNTVDLLYTDSDYPAFVFGMSVLALYGGFAGRLMSTVREKEGLTYGIYGHVEKITKESTGLWRISTFFDPKKAIQGLESTIREIRKIVKSGITDNELGRFKSILKTRQVLINDSMIKRAAKEHGLLLKGITEEEYDELNKKIQKLTKGQVNKALRTYINPDTLVISASGPVKRVKNDIKKSFS